MDHQHNINCLVGDIIRYYTTPRFSRLYKDEKDPTDIIFNINVDDLKEKTTNIIITDGIVQEFDFMNIKHKDHYEYIDTLKKVKVCRATYMIHIKYTKVDNVYNSIAVYVTMKDLSLYDKILRDMPNDVYFW